MPDLIASSLVATLLKAGGTTSLQFFGGSPGNQWLIADIEMPAADANTLGDNLPDVATFFKGNQTVNLSAANNTSYTVINSAGLLAGMQISIATQANAGAPTVLSINTVDNATTIHVTFVSGANANNVTSGDIFIVTSQPAGTSVTLNYPANNLAQVFNAI